MKITILHHDLEPAESKLRDLFEDRGVIVDLVDVRDADFDLLKGSDLIINRVYSSVASRDYASVVETLSLLKKLESSGVECLNSYIASLYEYSKFDAYKVLSEQGVLTPSSIFVDFEDNIDSVCGKAVEELGMPIVIKRNCGGRSQDISRVNSEKELNKVLREKFESAKENGYGGGFILQEFIRSSRDFDCRLGVINGEFSFSYKRSLISYNSKDKWLASIGKGSVMGNYDALDVEVKLALEVNDVTKCTFSESDVIFTEDGPCVIEINPIPGYDIDDEHDMTNLQKFVEFVVNKFAMLEVSV
jgi:glutathione synthase/RimK-type ligase-like ATP-grasp enzyme